MAQEIAKTAETSNKLTRNAAQPKTSDLVKQFGGDLSKQVDLTPYEQALGGLVEPGLIKKMLGWPNYVLRVMHAQREALKRAGKKGSLEEMVGDDANRTHFRGVVQTLCAAAVKAGHSKVELDCLVIPGHASLAALEAALTGGAAILVKQGAIKSKPPAFKANGVGAPEFTAGGHDPKLLAEAESRVKAIVDATR